ncbi:nucleotidyltransferase family protein [Marinihelvus fidelis]|uniref:Nucleotidyltransferase family protein n=1 Tax=Marinihelvus fidelis TaxID=2613842 RepID=A0A5N0TE77_9GAMM|nr:nucleotidyltransferase family protein [Marinihelvus fidelis]KAA9133403.1 nucleotidyltransferase family protein [Marinihelvus fidelis]
MRAMILAAGAGERLRPLTNTTPKPLIDVGGKPLIEWHLDNLARAGFRNVVINTGHLGEQIPAALGHGERWGLSITYSKEPAEALETGGGIHHALPLLGDGPFLVVSGDTWTDFSFAALRAVKCDYAHLVLVDNPPHHPDGDFALAGGRVNTTGEPRLTFGGIAVYHPRMFSGCQPGRWRITGLLRDTIDQHLVTGQRHRGAWFDSGSPERLERLRAEVCKRMQTATQSVA